MAVLVATLFILESLSVALWFARFLSFIHIYDAPVLILATIRLLVTMGMCASAGMLLQRRPPAKMFARWTMVASAVVLTFELGLRFSPSSVFPSHRWPLVAIYWTYAILVTGWTLRRGRIPDGN